jgi:hypothetical protein
VSDSLLPSTISVCILPVEVVNKDKVSVNELKVGKMAAPDVLNSEQAENPTQILNIDKDPDRFFVRISGAAFFGKSTVKLETVENPDDTPETPHNDRVCG